MPRKIDANAGSLLGAFVEDVKRTVRITADRYFTMGDLPLTENEFIQAFIVKEHVLVLMQAKNLCGSIGGDRYYRTLLNREDKALFDIRADAGLPIPVPNYVEHGVSPDCPEPLRQRISEWAQPRIDVGDMFGDLYDIITVFNKRVSNLRSFAIMLPCLPVLIQKTDRMKLERLRPKLEKGDFNLPRLPPEVAARVQAVSSLFMNVNMINEFPKVTAQIKLVRNTLCENRRRPHIFKDLDVFKGHVPNMGTSM
jgi:hypothetical protein